MALIQKLMGSLFLMMLLFEEGHVIFLTAPFATPLKWFVYLIKLGAILLCYVFKYVYLVLNQCGLTMQEKT